VENNMQTSLPATVPVRELMSLSPPEKLAVIGALWDSMSDTSVPIPDWQADELARRENADAANTEPTVTWDEAKQMARAAHAQPRSA
jgi:putative addiction module component (TIGR02574 family)